MLGMAPGVLARLWGCRDSARACSWPELISPPPLGDFSPFTTLASSFHLFSVVCMALRGCGQVATGSGVAPALLLCGLRPWQQAHVKQADAHSCRKNSKKANWGLTLGRTCQPISLAIFMDSKLPIRAGVQADFFGVLQIGDQRPNI